ncbi:hypothetical protein [Novosphingobium lindaniclasticum]|uniref:Uncharacterized protein n=1 Tax=Novosphingobium lindaniclasticum LE124 TaxID=1096930 RepID=T0IS81_9SPHN|nr:hypothetical protein [Novosphingobium lindaniclasticum]EQB12539.1 hypothetical protein L284_15530 [Novosphingobium lindaniclasticum LE124]
MLIAPLLALAETVEVPAPVLSMAAEPISAQSASGTDSATETTSGEREPAASLPVSLPENPPPPKDGHLKLGVGIRGRVDLRFNDAGSSGQRRTSTHLSFDTVILKLDYNSSTFFGAAEYRFYGGNFIYSRKNGYEGIPGEINFPAYAYIGAKLSAADKVTVGLQPVPFDDRYWGSSWYNSMGFVYGLEEVYDVGISYAHSGDKISVAAGLFPTTGPAVMGQSRDSARYSVNIVRGDSYLPDASDNAERNIVAGRIQYALASSDRGKLTLTGSAWLSDVHNFDTDRDGSRRAYALSLTDETTPLRKKLLVARQVINPANAGRSDLIAVGDYDSSYNIAAKSTMVFGELSHPIETRRFPLKVNLYGSYARVFKDAAGFADTQRFNLGALWTDKATGRIRVWTELLVGRNDPYVGAGQFLSGSAQGGDNRWKVSALIMAGYYF